MAGAVAHAFEAEPPKDQQHPVKWYRSTFYNLTILGLCNFMAPGIWGAMNSLGAGGAETPTLVNAANALTFCLMVLSCFFSSTIVHYIGIKYALVIGTIGYAPFAAGLYTNVRFGTEWLVLFGAALCGLSAGIFWMAEAAIAISYPEPWNKGKALGYWLTYRLCGQILGGAINLGLNVHKNTAGSVSYKVYQVFIALQAVGPFVAFFLNKPEQVQRRDGRPVNLNLDADPWKQIKRTVRLFFTRDFLLVVFWIGQAVFAEAVYFTYIDEWFSVRARALGSFLAGIVAVISGNLMGFYLDRNSLSLRLRTRTAFWTIVTLQGAWWTWITVMVTRYRQTQPTLDWDSDGFGAGFGVYVMLTIGFQINYLFLYFIVTNLATTESDVVHFAALLRGTESAWQAISYGLTSLTIFGQVGGVYFNFALWGVAVLPAWIVLRKFGSHEVPSDSEAAVIETAGAKGVVGTETPVDEIGTKTD